MRKTFTVKIHPPARPAIVVQGGVGPQGVYVETPPHRADDPGEPRLRRRIDIAWSELKQLPAGSDADFEITLPFPASAFE